MKHTGALIIAFIALAANAQLALALGFSDESQFPHKGSLGQPFSLQLKGRAGSPPYHFKIDSGELPPGLSLAPDGAITGSPSAAGTFKFWGNLADSYGKHSERLITITIENPPTTQPPAATRATTAPSSEKPGWKLTFHDDFDGARAELDTDKWIGCYRGNPALPANFVIKDGVLHLRIDRDLPTTRPGGRDRVSGMDTRRSKLNFAQQYGWFECRARTPRGSGVMAAFWLSPLDREYERTKADGGHRESANEAMEIDIFEQLGREPRQTNCTVHFGRSYVKPDHGAEHVLADLPFNPQDDFHVYALEWTEKQLIWYADGKEVHRSDKSPRTPFFIRLSVYEGDDAWRGPVDRAAPYPKDFEIDYVRVYERAERG